MAEEEATFAVKHFVAASVILYFCEQPPSPFLAPPKGPKESSAS